MLPEIQEYFNAVQDGDSRYSDAVDTAHRENQVPRWNASWGEAERTAYFDADDKLNTAVRAADRAKKERHAVALAVLKNSPDKLIHWLMNNETIDRNYTGHRDVVLRGLPMDRETMEEFGGRQGWCGEYTEFLNLAKDAGVLPEPTPPLADVTALVRDLRNNYGGTSRDVTRIIRRHLPAILESAERTKAEQVAAEEAKAALETLNAGSSVDTTPADVQPRRQTPVRNPDGTFAGSATVAA